jgi:hypothetical protein
MFATSMRGPTWPARLSYIAAGLFTLASAGTNLIYGWSKGTDTATSLVWAAVSLAVSAVFALSWPALIVSLDRRQYARAVLMLIALVVTGGYSISAALGSAMGGRANAAIEAKDTEDRKAKAQAKWDAAKAELDALAAAKPGAELQTLIDTAKADLAKLPATRSIAELEALMRRGCPARTALNGQVKTACPKFNTELARAWERKNLAGRITELTNDIARADQRRSDQREKAQATMDKAAAELARSGPTRVANSDAVALAAYLNILGLTIDADRVNKLLALLAVLCVECGGGLALAVGMALSEGDWSGQPDRAIVQGERSLAERATEQPNASPERESGNASLAKGLDRSPVLNNRPERSAHNRVLDALRTKDGVLFGSQVALGAVFGWSKTRMNEVLHQLEAAGRVRLSVSRQGTAVRLIAGIA